MKKTKVSSFLSFGLAVVASTTLVSCKVENSQNRVSSVKEENIFFKDIDKWAT